MDYDIANSQWNQKSYFIHDGIVPPTTQPNFTIAQANQHATNQVNILSKKH